MKANITSVRESVSNEIIFFSFSKVHSLTVMTLFTGHFWCHDTYNYKTCTDLTIQNYKPYLGSKCSSWVWRPSFLTSNYFILYLCFSFSAGELCKLIKFIGCKCEEIKNKTQRTEEVPSHSPIDVFGEREDPRLNVVQQYHQVAAYSTAWPLLNDNWAGWIHFRDLIWLPFGQVIFSNTLFIMFSTNQFSKGLDQGS